MLAKLKNMQILSAVIVGLLLIGIAIGLLVGIFSTGGTEERYIALDSGGAIIAEGQGNVWGPAGTGRLTLEEQLPSTLLEATTNGWSEQSACIQNTGKIFAKGNLPYLLTYNTQNELIGVYLISKSEKPLPWKKLESLSAGSKTIIAYEHWSLVVHLKNPANACEST